MTTISLTQILLVEDNPADARLIEEYITEQSWPNIEPERPSIKHVDRLTAAHDALTDDIDLVLLDLGLPDSTGVGTLDGILSVGASAPVVVLTGLEDERVGVDAVEHGAQDYLVKDEISPRLLQQTLQYAVRREEHQQELRQRNTELALLNQVVRHDIRNDVAVIVGWGDGLRAHVDEVGEDSLDRMLSACEHISSITETVGDFLSVLEGDDDPELHPVDVESVLMNEVDKARSAHDEASISVTSEIPDVPAVRATDLLSSVFRNILNNAVSHNDAAVPEISITITADSDTVSVAIADNGPGISDTQKDEIFGRGEMGLESSGSGIGLYLVDTLVDMYNGSVVLTDNDPTGSVFTVVLNTAK